MSIDFHGFYAVLAPIRTHKKTVFGTVTSAPTQKRFGIVFGNHHSCPQDAMHKTNTYLAVSGTNSANISLICYIGRLTEANSARADTTYLSTSTTKLQDEAKLYISIHRIPYG